MVFGPRYPQRARKIPNVYPGVLISLLILVGPNLLKIDMHIFAKELISSLVQQLKQN